MCDVANWMLRSEETLWDSESNIHMSKAGYERLATCLFVALALDHFGEEKLLGGFEAK